MANLPDSPSFDDVYQLEQTDTVDAGENGDGIANAQARNLANRTRYLKDAHDMLADSLKPVATSGSYNDLSDKPTLGSAATADASDFATAAQGTLATNALPASEKGAVNGVASLDAAGKVPESQLPPVTSVSLYEVANEAALFALTATKGDIARRQDSGLTYMHRGTGFGDIRDWLKLSPDLPTLGSAATADASDFATAAQGTLATNALPASEKGAVNGVASLDATGKVPAAQLPDFDASGKQDVLDALSLAFVNKGAGNTKVLREDGVWIDPPSGGGGGGISEAPQDGKTYGRKDATWAEVVSGEVKTDIAAMAGAWDMLPLTAFSLGTKGVRTGKLHNAVALPDSSSYTDYGWIVDSYNQSGRNFIAPISYKIEVVAVGDHVPLQPGVDTYNFFNLEFLCLFNVSTPEFATVNIQGMYGEGSGLPETPMVMINKAKIIQQATEYNYYTPTP